MAASTVAVAIGLEICFSCLYLYAFKLCLYILIVYVPLYYEICIILQQQHLLSACEDPCMQTRSTHRWVNARYFNNVGQCMLHENFKQSFKPDLAASNIS